MGAFGRELAKAIAIEVALGSAREIVSIVFDKLRERFHVPKSVAHGNETDDAGVDKRIDPPSEGTPTGDVLA